MGGWGVTPAGEVDTLPCDDVRHSSHCCTVERKVSGSEEYDCFVIGGCGSGRVRLLEVPE